MNTVSRAWQRLCDLHLRGPWRPGGYNVVLLIVQVVVIWTAAQRGMDYVNLPPHPHGEGSMPAALSGIEADVPLDILGYSFLIPAGVAFVGLATGWARMVSLGHLFIGTSYLVLGMTFLRDSPVTDLPQAALGSLMVVVSAVLLVAKFRRLPDIVAMAAGVVSLMAGGWLAAKGLGYGYRTGNGFLGASVIHFVLGFGTQLLARREERLRREEEEDLRVLGAGVSTGGRGAH